MKDLCRHYRRNPGLEDYIHATSRQVTEETDPGMILMLENGLANVIIARARCPIMKDRYFALYRRLQGRDK